MQVSRVKHITEGGKENCRCTFKIRWLAGPHVGERANVHCKSIYLLQFRNVENHQVLRERNYLKVKNITSLIITM